jgi:hypothetical protein
MVSYFQNLAAQFTNPVTAIAQILGFIPMILGFFVFYFNNRKRALVVKTICDALFVVHFCLLSQWTGAVVSVVNTVRGVLFSQRGKNPYLSMLWVPFLICGLTVGGSLLSWSGPLSLLPMFGSCLAAIGYWCNDTRWMRKFNLVGISLWWVYAVLTMSVPSILNNTVYIVSILRTEIVLLLQKRKDR